MISVVINASSVSAERGISFNPVPLPLKNEPVAALIIPSTYKLPLISTEPVNSEPLSADLTLNPNTGETDAVTLPLLISVDINASSVSAERGISFNPAPLPLKNEPVATCIFPLTIKEPVN